MAGASIIDCSRFAAERIKPGIAALSGKFRQYFFGMWLSIECTFNRAGLKMLE